MIVTILINLSSKHFSSLHVLKWAAACCSVKVPMSFRNSLIALRFCPPMSSLCSALTIAAATLSAGGPLPCLGPSAATAAAYAAPASFMAFTTGDSILKVNVSYTAARTSQMVLVLISVCLTRCSSSLWRPGSATLMSVLDLGFLRLGLRPPVLPVLAGGPSSASCIAGEDPVPDASEACDKPGLTIHAGTSSIEVNFEGRVGRWRQVLYQMLLQPLV
mmetsp:Transcript_71105/g.201530  ORF Transcript_71105/g.201530 Transcript_71105/m.201530 type:complete len:218 (+) Transcript_71105:171-824(+)